MTRTKFIYPISIQHYKLPVDRIRLVGHNHNNIEELIPRNHRVFLLTIFSLLLNKITHYNPTDMHSSTPHYAKLFGIPHFLGSGHNFDYNNSNSSIHIDFRSYFPSHWFPPRGRCKFGRFLLDDRYNMVFPAAY